MLSQEGADRVPRPVRRADRPDQRRLPARGQAVPDAGRRLHRRQAPQRRRRRGTRAAGWTATRSPSRSSTATWAGSSGAVRGRTTAGRRWSRSAADTACTSMLTRAGPAGRRHHRHRHGRRRRRLVRPAAPGGARHRAAGRPADGADRAGRAGRRAGQLWGIDVPAPLPRRGRAGRSPGRQHRAGRAEPGARRSGRRARRRRRDAGRPRPGAADVAAQPLDIVADVAGLDEDPTAVRRIRGQVAVATTPGQVRSVALDPADAPACPEALAAIATPT